jgi:hypothetical protein
MSECISWRDQFGEQGYWQDCQRRLAICFQQHQVGAFQSLVQGAKFAASFDFDFELATAEFEHNVAGPSTADDPDNGILGKRR